LTARKQALDDALVEMVVKDLQPFSVVEDEGFRAFVGKLDPAYTLPTRRALKIMVCDKYHTTKEKVKAELRDAAVCVSLTSDMWTSNNMDSYLGVTCHFTKEDQICSRLLGVAKFTGTHTAEHIKDAKDLLIADWGLQGIVRCLVTDNAANMLLCASLMKISHVSCFAHTLNLVVKKALDDTADLAAIRSKARRIVTLFRSSCTAKDRLADVQRQMGRPQLKLIQEVETRWNSTFSMFQRLHDQREPVGAALSSLRTEVTAMSSAENDTICQSFSILAPFNHATVELSAESNASASKVSLVSISPTALTIQHM